MKADILGQSMPLKRLLIAALLLVTGLAVQEWEPVHIVGMPYVAQARDARISGVVRLRCVLNSDGSVADVEILSCHKIFLISVTENARQWRFAAKRERTAAPGGAPDLRIQADQRISLLVTRQPSRNR